MRLKTGKVLRRRLDILRSAAGVFRQRGFDGATIEEIAGRLGMTKGSLYYYFKDKEEILYFTQSYSLDRLLEHAGRIERLKLPPERKLRELIVAQMRCMLDELKGSSAHIEFHALSPKKLRAIISKRDRYERKLRAVVEQGQRSRVFVKCDPKLATLAMLGAMNWAVKWYRPEGPMSVDGIAHAFAELFVRGLCK